MESKLNLRAIQEYSEELASIFINELPAQKKHFGGKELLELNQIKQVNLFMVREIFFGWRQQIEGIKNPYFDFESEEVKSGLNKFMNLLSRHIKVNRNSLQPIYSKAINDTILFYLVPDFFLIRLIKDISDELLTKETFKSLKNYIALNRGLYESLLEKIAGIESELLDRDELIKLVSEIPYEAEEKEIFDYFSAKKELQIDSFLDFKEEKAAEIAIPTPTRQPKSKKEETWQGFEFENENILNEKFKHEELPTLNDKLKKPTQKTVADNIQKPKGQSLAKAIALSQKFVFVKALFDGQLSDYEGAIKKLEDFNGWETANQFIEDELALKYNWDISSQPVEDFVGVVKARFS